MDRSETIGELAAALATAQGQMANAKKDAANPFYKAVSADLSSIVDAIKAPLSTNGIAYVQTTDNEDGTVIVETTLLHTSGEWLSSRLRMRPVKDDPQGIGSCITYARRYGLQAILGVAADDDDGNAASGKAHKFEAKGEATPEHVCPIHHVAFRANVKNGHTFYSHKTPDGWCNEPRDAETKAVADSIPIRAAAFETAPNDVQPAVPTAEQKHRAELIERIGKDRDTLLLTDAQLTGNAKKAESVMSWLQASTAYLEKLANRLADQIAVKQTTALRPTTEPPADEPEAGQEGEVQ